MHHDKHKAPLGFAPVLRVSTQLDSSKPHLEYTVTQASAILRYVGKVTGHYPTDNWNCPDVPLEVVQLLTDELMDAVYDIH